jgi:hypothetical protein
MHIYVTIDFVQYYCVLFKTQYHCLISFDVTGPNAPF